MNTKLIQSELQRVSDNLKAIVKGIERAYGSAQISSYDDADKKAINSIKKELECMESLIDQIKDYL